LAGDSPPPEPLSRPPSPSGGPKKIPLLDAKARVDSKREAEFKTLDAKNEPKPGFYAFLREQLGVEYKDLARGKATKMVDVAKRFKLRQDALEMLSDFGTLSWVRQNRAGGYEVPNCESCTEHFEPSTHFCLVPKYGDYAGFEFTKSHVLGALHQGVTQANQDDKDLSDASLKWSKDAQEWLADLDGSHAITFASMGVQAFRDYLATAKNDSLEARASSSNKRHGDGKKRRHSGDKKGKGKGRAGKRVQHDVDSDNMDDDEDGSSAGSSSN
jgi:hypothetical protein